MKLVLLTVFFAAAAINAQETSTNTSVSESSKSFYQMLKDSPFSLSAVSEFTYRDDFKKDEKTETTEFINQYGNDTTFHLSYKLSDLDSLRLNTGMYNQISNKDDSADTSWNGATIRYKRSSILSEKTHGVEMSAETRFNLYDGRTKNQDNLLGSTSMRANFSKTLAPKFDMVSILRWDQNIRTSGKEDLLRTYLAAYFIPVYKLSKKFTLSSTFAYKHYMKGGDLADSNRVNIVPEVSYTVSDMLSVATYWDVTPIKSNDGQFITKGWVQDGKFGLYASISIF
jgi:hypothetical protein